jgi:hypothetical protein
MWPGSNGMIEKTANVAKTRASTITTPVSVRRTT